MSAKRSVVHAMQAICGIVPDVRANVKLFQRLPVHLQRSCCLPVHTQGNRVIIGGSTGGIAEPARSQCIAQPLIIGGGSYAAGRKNTETVPIAKPFGTDAYR